MRSKWLQLIMWFFLVRQDSWSQLCLHQSLPPFTFGIILAFVRSDRCLSIRLHFSCSSDFPSLPFHLSQRTKWRYLTLSCRWLHQSCIRKSWIWDTIRSRNHVIIIPNNDEKPHYSICQFGPICINISYEIFGVQSTFSTILRLSDEMTPIHAWWILDFFWIVNSTSRAPSHLLLSPTKWRCAILFSLRDVC